MKLIAQMMLCMVVVCLRVNAQNAVFEPVHEASSDIHRMAYDKHGFIWMASDRGILRYDGYDVNLLMRSDGHYETVTSILMLEDKCWTGYRDGSLIQWDINRLTSRLITLPELESAVTGIFFTGKNVIISTYGQGLFEVVGDTGMEGRQVAPSPEEIYAMSGLGNSMFLATDFGVVRFDAENDGTWESVDTLLADKIVVDLFRTGNKNLLLRTHSGETWLVSPGNNYLTTRLSTNVHGLNSLGSYWLTFADDKLKLFKEIGQGQQLIDSLSLGGLSIESSIIDEANNVLVSVEGGKILQANLNIRKYDHRLPTGIQCIVKSPSSLYLGTENGLKVTGLKSAEFKTWLPGSNVSTLDWCGNWLLVGTLEKGVAVLSTRGNIISFLDSTNGLGDDAVLDVAVLNDTMFYLSCLTGLYEIVMNPGTGKIQSCQMVDPRLSASYIYSILPLAPKHLYLGTDREGFMEYSKGNIQRFQYALEPSDSMEIGSVYSMIWEESGTLWLSTTKLGVLSLREERIHRMEEAFKEEGAYHSIAVTGGGKILMLRSNSVELMDPISGHVRNFKRVEGFKETQPFINNLYNDGTEIWFVDNDEVYIFKDSPFESMLYPKTVIESIEVNNEPIHFANNVLPQHKNNVRFRFTGSWIANAPRLKYNYLLEGYDQKWTTTRERWAPYTNLPPGKYIFKVRASENDSFDDQPMAEIAITIKRAIHNSWWFWVIIAAALLYLYNLWVKRDRQRVRMKNEIEKMRIESQLITLKNQLDPHFLFNSFNTLIALIEEEPEKGVRYTQCMTDYYRSIMDITEKEVVPLNEELKMLDLYGKLIKERFEDGVLITIDKNISEEFFIPPMTLQLLVENAIKHNVVDASDPLHINIEISANGIVVSNPIRPKASSSTSGKGLENISRRYELLAKHDISIQRTNELFVVSLPAIPINAKSG